MRRCAYTSTTPTPQAREAVDQQREFAILQLPAGSPELDVSSASGSSVAQLLTQVAPLVARRSAWP